MSDLTNQLYRTVALRIFVAWLLLAILLCGATYWLEATRVDNFVFDLAGNAARHFTRATSTEIFNGKADLHKENIQDLLNKSQFVAIRLYANDQTLLLETWGTREPALLSAIAAHVHTFPDLAGRHHNKIQVKDDLFIQVVLPLVSGEQKIYGYFEGIYKVAPETREVIVHRVKNALLLVLLIVSVTSLALYPVIVSLNRESVHLSEALLDSNIELMRTLGSAIAQRDSDTDTHNYRVTLYAIRLAEALQRPREEIASLIAGAFLHDVGKIGIPDGILHKPGKLDSAEFAIMQTHVLLGEEIISESQWLAQARDVVAFHHEKFDGTGYPHGLKGAEIPFNARLFAVVDVFDALTSKRPYKKAMQLREAVTILMDGKGTHFDPGILDAFGEIAEVLYRQYASADSECLRGCLVSLICMYFRCNPAAHMDDGGENKMTEHLKDPVCGMAVEGDSRFRHAYQGHTYLFCSEYCLKKFQAALTRGEIKC